MAVAASGAAGNPSSLHAVRPGRPAARRGGPRDAGRSARRPAERGRLHRRRHRGGQPGRQGPLLARRSEDPDRRRILASAVEHHAVMDAVLWLAEHEGAVGRVAARSTPPAGCTRRRSRPRSPPTPASVALVTVMWANNEVGTVQPIAELAAVAPAYGVPVPLRRRAGVRAAAGRLRRQRPGRDDRDRSQDRRTARRRRARPRPRRSTWCRCCTAAARSATSAPAPSTPRPSSGFAAAAEVAVKRQRGAGRAARRAARRPGTPGARRRPGRRPRRRPRPVDRRTGCPATRTSRSPAARATRCCCCSTPAASSAPPARPARPACRSPATCCSRWASPRTLARGSLRFSLGHTSTQADVDAVVEAIGPVVERARRAGQNGVAVPPRIARASDRGAPMRVLAAMSGGVDSAVAAARAVDAGHDVTGVHLALSSNPTVVPHRRPRLLHPRGRPRRPPGRRRDRHPVLRLGPRRAVPRRTSSTTSSPSTPPAARPTRACAATRRSSSRPCSTRRWRWASTPSAPVTTPASSDGRLLPRRRRGQGPVLRPRRADRASSWRTRCSRSATPARTTSGARPSSAAWPSPTSPTATTSASSPTATPPASCSARSAPSPARSSTPTACRSASTTAPTPSPSASAGGCGSAGPAPDGRPRYVLDVSPVTRTVTVGPAEELDVGAAGRRPAGVERAGTRRTDRRASRRSARTASRCPRPRGATATTLVVELAEPLRGVAPGQAVVLYDGDAVLGSATIAIDRADAPVPSRPPDRSCVARVTATGYGGPP